MFIIKKIEIKKEEKVTIAEQAELKNSRITSLVDLRKSQETRLDSLYQKGWWNSAKETEQIIKEANDDINRLNQEVDSLNLKIQNINDTISYYEIQKIDLRNNDLAGEIGPLKYVAAITKLPIDNVVNYLILICIFLADPVAVVLVVATNKVIKLNRQEKNQKEITRKDKEEQGEKEAVDKSENKEEKTEDDIKNPVTIEGENEFKEELQKTSLKKNENEEEYDKIAQYEADKNGEFNKVTDIQTKSNPKIIKEMINVDTDNIVPGVFTAETASNNVVKKEKDLEKESEYTKMLKVLYKNGSAQKGEQLPSSQELKNLFVQSSIVVDDKIINDFLIICNLLKIVVFNNTIGFYNKDYEDALSIILEI
jgi:hypothetical protein